MFLCLLLLFCDLMSVNFDWSIILIRKSFGASRHISEKLGVKLAILVFSGGYQRHNQYHNSQQYIL